MILSSKILSDDLINRVSARTKKIRKRSFVFLQWIFLPITLILFGALPALEAQIRLMFGSYMGFWVTEKVRR